MAPSHGKGPELIRSSVGQNSPTKPARIRIAGLRPLYGRPNGVELAPENSQNTGSNDADRLRFFQNPNKTGGGLQLRLKFHLPPRFRPLASAWLSKARKLRA